MMKTGGTDKRQKNTGGIQSPSVTNGCRSHYPKLLSRFYNRKYALVKYILVASDLTYYEHIFYHFYDL